MPGGCTKTTRVCGGPFRIRRRITKPAGIVGLRIIHAGWMHEDDTCVGGERREEMGDRREERGERREKRRGEIGDRR